MAAVATQNIVWLSFDCVQVSCKILDEMHSNHVHLNDTEFWILRLNKEYLLIFLFCSYRVTILI